MKVALFLVVALCAVTFALQHERTVIAGENRFFKPDTWKVGVEAPLDGKIDIYIFMTQSNLDKLDEAFNKHTTPGEPEWRHWWSSEEVKNLIATPSAQKFKVARWLKSAGVDRSNIVDMKDTFKVTTTIEIASALFETKFYTFQHIASGTIVYRQLGAYSIPTAVTSVVEFVTGVSEFPFATRKFGYSRPAKLDDEEGKVVPYVIDQLYSIPYAQKSSVTKRTSVGVVEYQGDRSFSQTDLTYFQQQNNLPQQQVPTAQIVGPYEPSEPDAEATLDIQYAWGVSYNTSAWYWTVEGWLLEWAVEFQNTPAPKPSVVSMSWGWTEDNQCEIAPCSDSSTYVDRVNTEFKAIGMTGVTITASSGDQGAPGDGDDNCRNTKEPLSSIFPGASPYVLSIGATMLVNNNSTTVTEQADPSQPKPPICSTYTCASVSTTEEVACSYPEALITTGGGFSDYSPRPSWQNAVVTSYLNVVPPSSLPPASSFNANNRGFPDVSALGHNYLIRRDNTWEDVDGTSCSAPVWAGIISLFNEYEVANGRPVLGFINPLIYQAYGAEANAFNDIVNGDNKCSESECCEYGYVTAIGWDPVTGLGSPNFGTLYSYIQTQSATLYKQ